MCNETGEDVWLVFNGEIWNYQELRRELLEKGHTFRTRSDTETIIHAYEEYGVDCVARLHGMFGSLSGMAPANAYFSRETARATTPSITPR